MYLQFNGWQRLWAFLSVLYFLLLLSVPVFPSMWGWDSVKYWHLLLLWGIPVASVYLLGIFVGWIYCGFKNYGFKHIVGWRRIWMLLSIVYMVLTFGIVYEKVGDEVARHRILKNPPPDSMVQDYRAVQKSKEEVKKEEALNKKNGKPFEIVFPDKYVEIPGKYRKSLGAYTILSDGRIFYADERVSALIGKASPYAIEVKDFLGKRGKYNELARLDVPREVALSVMEKQAPYFFYIQIIKVFGVWVISPFLVYILVWFLVTGICWVYVGFWNKSVA